LLHLINCDKMLDTLLGRLGGLNTKYSDKNGLNETRPFTEIDIFTDDELLKLREKSPKERKNIVLEKFKQKHQNIITKKLDWENAGWGTILWFLSSNFYNFLRGTSFELLGTPLDYLGIRPYFMIEKFLDNIKYEFPGPHPTLKNIGIHSIILFPLIAGLPYTICGIGYGIREWKARRDTRNYVDAKGLE